MQDKYEEVHDKEYEFNKEDEAEFMKLLKAIYHQATTLEFLDDKSLFVEADKRNTMKNVHEFIELLLAKSS
jgi:hypothetical protein